MFTDGELSKNIEIISECWCGERTNDIDDEEIEYLYCSNSMHSLFLNVKDGLISIGCHFQYDDNPEVDIYENDKEYWLENAFYEFLDRNGKQRISSWHDFCYDLGYPGTDYERFVGYRAVPCTEEIIREYLTIIEQFDREISTLQNAIDYLYMRYMKGLNSRNIHACFDKECWEMDDLHELEVSYEGVEYYFCRSNGQVYVCIVQEYKQIYNLFSNCAIHFNIGISDDYLWFTSPYFSVRMKLSVVDASYLEMEQYFLQTKQTRNLLAMEQLFGDNAPHKSEETIRKDKELAKIIATACIKLIQKPLFQNQTENVRNDEIRDYLSMAGYDVKDQTRTGYSALGISVGEVDLMVVKSNIPYAFIEAQNLKNVNSKYIQEHIERIYKYDKIGTSANYLVSYINTTDSVGFTQKYLKCITSYSTGMKVVEFDLDVKDVLDSSAANIRIIKVSYIRNKNITDLYHILAFFAS